ncbi:GATA transcription factor 5 [Platanthera guangdongensis]|uniref:GATA transcription factor 5 n=1 Tax=Platanthera guangdongensis TaxID=2320717 RepID=A0ABR2MY67_9ASPA
MLHQTLLTFRPFPSSSSSSSSFPSSYHLLPYPPPASSSSSNPADRLLSSHLRNTCSSQVEMEVMKEMMLCSSVHDKGFPADKVNDDDGWGSEKGNPLSEDFLVDDLLDLRGLPESEEEEEEEEEDMDVVRVSEGGGLSTEKTFTASQNEPPELYSEITLQETDAASLEWLSHFFDECSTEFPSPARPSYFGMLPSLPAQTPLVKYSSGCRNPAGVSLSSTATAAGSLSTEGLIPVKAKRSKRLRGNGALWSRSGQLRLADSSSASSITTFSSASPSSSYSSSSSSFNSYISYEPSSAFAGFLLDDMEAQPKGHNPKKRGRRPKNLLAVPAERRCAHCGVHKTPQWRAGPQGAKTLCNACGVRFKSGRLLPEYRPACSPTFVSHVHSNSHRKVLEMRRKKDEEVLVVSAPPVSSC